MNMDKITVPIKLVYVEDYKEKPQKLIKILDRAEFLNQSQCVRKDRGLQGFLYIRKMIVEIFWPESRSTFRLILFACSANFNRN